MLAAALVAKAFFGTALAYKVGFDYAMEYRAFPAELAMRDAMPAPWLRPRWRRILATFQADKRVPANFGPTKFAASLDGVWFFADQFGFARLDGAPGRVDVLGLELALADVPSLRKYRSTLLVLSVRNLESRPASVVASSGRTILSVPPGAMAQTLSWLTWHKLFVAGRAIASLTPWSELRAPGGYSGTSAPPAGVRVHPPEPLSAGTTARLRAFRGFPVEQFALIIGEKGADPLDRRSRPRSHAAGRAQ